MRIQNLQSLCQIFWPGFERGHSQYDENLLAAIPRHEVACAFRLTKSLPYHLRHDADVLIPVCPLTTSSTFLHRSTTISNWCCTPAVALVPSRRAVPRLVSWSLWRYWRCPKLLHLSQVCYQEETNIDLQEICSVVCNLPLRVNLNSIIVLTLLLGGGGAQTHVDVMIVS